MCTYKGKAMYSQQDGSPQFIQEEGLIRTWQAGIWSWNSSLQNYEKTTFCCLSTQSITQLLLSVGECSYSSLSAGATRGSLEFLEVGKTYESVKVSSRLQPLGISHSHIRPHPASSNLGELSLSILASLWLKQLLLQVSRSWRWCIEFTCLCRLEFGSWPCNLSS